MSKKGVLAGCSCVLDHMLMGLMVELQWQLAAEDQSGCSLMEATLFEAVQAGGV